MPRNGEARIALIGFGEAGRAFRRGWGKAVTGRVTACDIARDDPARGPAMRAAAEEMPLFAEPAPALTEAEVVFCLVTADQAGEAARSAAPHINHGLLWLDGNSCSPGSKRKAAAIVENAGGRYVDMAIMAPVAPRLHKTPSLLSGPHADEALGVLSALGMNAKVAGTKVGDASAIKMLRSVMVKGFEALTAECMLAARRAGVESDVLASLQASDPGWDWTERANYNLERMLAHGARRATEMREVAATLTELGLPDRMARATAEWEGALAGKAPADKDDDLASRLDRILAAIET